MGEYWLSQNYHAVQHSKMELYSIFYAFVSQAENTAAYKEVIKECLKLDIFINDNVKTLPDWLQENAEDKQKRWEYFNNAELIQQKVPHLAEQTPKQLSKSCYIGFFQYDVLSPQKEKSRLSFYLIMLKKMLLCRNICVIV